MGTYKVTLNLEIEADEEGEAIMAAVNMINQSASSYLSVSPCISSNAECNKNDIYVDIMLDIDKLDIYN
jgi:hypothetical protein